MPRWLRYSTLIAISFASIAMLGLAISLFNPKLFDRYFPFLLVLNAVIAAVLFCVVTTLCLRLARRQRSKQYGSHMTAKLALTTALISVVPTLTVYAISTAFISRSLQDSFSPRVEASLDAGVRITQEMLAKQEQSTQELARDFADALAGTPDSLMLHDLLKLLEPHSGTEALVLTSTGSAVAAAAYLSCSRMLNDYDGVQHDYTRKHGLIYQEVMLPPMAPPKWKNREQLWNAVEAAEKTKDSRLAREFVVALPIELDKDSNISLLQNFIQKNFVDMGMCADFAIHDTDGHNPHAHILLTVRPLNENGTWQYKTEKEYLCIKDGEEKGFTASEFKDAQKEGWEKQYRYKAGKKKVYLTPSAAQEKGYERIDKHPKSTRYGRQNPISEQWNSEEQLCLWRANWADAVNKMLALNQINAAIDHRSFAAQGITEQPTIHEGYIAQNMEKKGMIADRCEINRRVRADNRILRELKTQIKKLVQAVEKSIPVIAETLEAIRNHMIFTQYHLLHNEMQKEVIHDWMQHFRPILNKYDTIKKKLKAKVTEKKELNVQKSKTSILNPFQHIKLNQQLTTVTEEIEELKSAKEQLLFQAECSTEKDMASLSRKYDQMDKNLDILDSQDMALKEQLEKDAVAFQEEKLRPKPEQYTELLDARIQIRPTFREKLIEQLKGTFGEYYDYHYRDIATHEVDDLNMEDPYSFSHRTWELEYQRKQELQKKHPVQSRQKSHNTEL